MIDIMEIVSERPSEEEVGSNPICPLCNNSDIDAGGFRTTCLGYFGGVNPNHTWTECYCKNCNKSFVRETKSGNVWYTSDGFVLKGMPNCFEKYYYTCSKCSGKVLRKYTALDGISEVQGLSTRNIDGKWVKEYRIFYECEKCGHGGEVKDDHWYKEKDS